MTVRLIISSLETVWGKNIEGRRRETQNKETERGMRTEEGKRYGKRGGEMERERGGERQRERRRETRERRRESLGDREK